MTNLKEINFGLNQYCGPAVLSALTGKSTDECAAVISKINGQRVITAVQMKDLMKAFELLRFDVTKQPVFGRTLYAALVSLFKHEGFYIVLIPKHVVAVEVGNDKIYLVDNHSKQPLDAAQSARLMQKVLDVYKVTPKPEPKIIKYEYKTEDKGSGEIRIHKETHFDIVDMKSETIAYIYCDNNIDLNQIATMLINLVDNRRKAKTP